MRGTSDSPLFSSSPRTRGSSVLALFFVCKARPFARPGRASYLSCSCKKGNRKNTPLALRFSGRRPEKSASADLCSADCTSLCRRRNRRDPSRRPCGHRGPLPTQREGTRGAKDKDQEPGPETDLRRLGERQRIPATPQLLVGLRFARTTFDPPRRSPGTDGRRSHPPALSRRRATQDGPKNARKGRAHGCARVCCL